jgi:CRISPR-associated protein Cmr4
MEESMEKTYWLHAISPLHVGAGRGVGYIDLPLAREKGTNWPYIPGSAVKGVIADSHGATEIKRKSDPLAAAAFGKAGEDDASAGSLVFSDASIVCLPVRSFYGTFAWITSPLALRRLRRRDLAIPSIAEVKHIYTIAGNKISQGAKVYLEDFDLEAQSAIEIAPLSDPIANSLFTSDAEKEIFKTRFAIVHDDIFTFLCETGTQVDARIRIKDEQKTVARGALWYEESLPIETSLAGTVWCDKVFGNPSLTQANIIERYCKAPRNLQIGGKATTGKGRVRCLFS